MADAIKDRLSGAAAVKALIDECLIPDEYGRDKIERGEFDRIIAAYHKTKGRFTDGRASIEAYAAEKKPALYDAIVAARDGAEDPYIAYVKTQVGFDALSSRRGGASAPTPSPPRDSGDLAGARRIVMDIYKRGPQFANDVNGAGDTAERTLAQVCQGKDLSDADFAQMRAAATDEAAFTFLTQRVDSVHLQAFRWLRENPGASKSDFVSYVRANLPL